MKPSNPAVSEEKETLRREMLAERRALSFDDVNRMSAMLTEQIEQLPEYRKAHRIMAFLAMKGESNLDELIAHALSEGKEVYVPVCLPERQMEAGRLTSMDHFEKGPLGLRNIPAGYEVCRPEDLDLVLVPGIACDREGHRLGMGAGYYDRYLEHIPFHKRVITIWDFQVLPKVPADEWDLPMSAIVTDKQIIRI